MENQFVALKMRTETLLVIYEYLSRSYDEWRRTASESDESFILAKPDPGERVALWRLEGEIERTIPEIFCPEYNDLLSEEKRRLTNELYGESTARKVDLDKKAP
jgi:hypothetical protein